MNREELLKLHEELCKEALNLMKRKNHDYAGNEGVQPFANFERCEAMGICATEQGMLVRIVDKLSRLSTFVSCGKLQVENESYKDAIVDIINYCVLLYGFTQQKESPNRVEYTVSSSQYLAE
jgi:hypothetical protein